MYQALHREKLHSKSNDLSLAIEILLLKRGTINRMGLGRVCVFEFVPLGSTRSCWGPRISHIVTRGLSSRWNTTVYVEVVNCSRLDRRPDLLRVIEKFDYKGHNRQRSREYLNSTLLVVTSRTFKSTSTWPVFPGSSICVCFSASS